MKQMYSDRILNTKPSFVREILKAVDSKDTISFAGGLPNPISFPKEALAESAVRVIQNFGDKTFQYSTTEGYLPLREYIAERYQKRFGLSVDADDILITTGSQQALDLIGKVLLNKGNPMIIEKPGYLGAIQAFSMCEPTFLPVTLEDDGINIEELRQTMEHAEPKLIYTVPNFQNPSGRTYSAKKRKQMTEIVQKYDSFLIEDDPYGELRFSGEELPYMGAELPEQSILLGTFSKTVSPGIRMGYLCTRNKELYRNLVTAKQGTDLHTDIFTQYMLYDYLVHNEYEVHMQKIKELYRKQSSAMVAAIEEYFPKTVGYTKPEGGMFLWITLPEGMSANALIARAQEEHVIFVPGDSFYTDETDVNTLRLNYTNCNEDTIREGIRRLGKLIDRF